LYKVTKGAAKNSYGLNVAKIAGIPPSILKEAASKSEELKNAITQRAFNNHYVNIFREVIETLQNKKPDEKDKENLLELHKKACTIQNK
jgi:DNA mismatch repair ATPase MutS